MAQYFDIGLYYANWGQVICYLKVPSDTNPQVFMCIDDGDSVTCEKVDGYVLFTFSVDENDYYMDDDDAKDYLNHLVELRSELMEGDYRLLYLPCLKRAFDGDKTLAELPLINFNFKQLSEAQSAFAELFGVPPEAYNALDMLLKSSQSHTVEVKYLTATEQVNRLSASDKDLLLKSLVVFDFIHPPFCGCFWWAGGFIVSRIISYFNCGYKFAMERTTAAVV
ncbi:hypothetical protein [Xenorhabdus hominickii]|nr:hypothetical protein [Xenorhabdus hominickii]